MALLAPAALSFGQGIGRAPAVFAISRVEVSNPSGESYTEKNMALHTMEWATVLSYPESLASILEVDPSQTVSLADVSQHDAQLSYFFLSSGQDAIFHLGGGANQLDYYEDSQFESTSFYELTGYGIMPWLQKMAQESGENLGGSPPAFETAPGGETYHDIVVHDLGSLEPVASCRVYPLDGKDGPFGRIEFYRQGKLFKTIQNAEFFPSEGEPVLLVPQRSTVTHYDEGENQTIIHRFERVIVNPDFAAHWAQAPEPLPGTVITHHRSAPDGTVSQHRLDSPRREDLEKIAALAGELAPRPAPEDAAAGAVEQAAEPPANRQVSPRTARTAGPSPEPGRPRRFPIWIAALAALGVLGGGAAAVLRRRRLS
ncbi:MAG: hypothetical protein RLY93_13075 [Sumerlaeia bacterium]